MKCKNNLLKYLQIKSIIVKAPLCAKPFSVILNYGELI